MRLCIVHRSATEDMAINQSINQSHWLKTSRNPAGALRHWTRR